MIPYIPGVMLWILIMAFIWEKIKLDKKHEKEFEQWRENCRAYERALNKKMIADYEEAVANATEQASKDKNHGASKGNREVGEDTGHELPEG